MAEPQRLFPGFPDSLSREAFLRTSYLAELKGKSVAELKASSQKYVLSDK
jgi:hypothetical protein